MICSLPKIAMSVVDFERSINFKQRLLILALFLNFPLRICVRLDVLGASLSIYISKWSPFPAFPLWCRL